MQAVAEQNQRCVHSPEEDMHACFFVSHLNHVEFFLARAAVRTTPRQRHIIPPGAWRDAGRGIAFFFLIDIATNHA